jgi:hypothetical protein
VTIKSILSIRRYKLRCRSHQNRHNLQTKSQSESISSEQLFTENSLGNVGTENTKKVNTDDDNLILLTNGNDGSHKIDRLFATKTNREDGHPLPYIISPSIRSPTIRSRLSGKISNTNTNTNTNTISSTSTSSTNLVKHYSSSRQQHRKFNDLWVRLETVTTK